MHSKAAWQQKRCKEILFCAYVCFYSTCGSLALLSVMSPSPVSLLGTLLGPQGCPGQARFSGTRPHVGHDSLQGLLLGCCCSSEVAGCIGVQHCALVLSRVSLMCQCCSTHIQSMSYAESAASALCICPEQGLAHVPVLHRAHTTSMDDCMGCLWMSQLGSAHTAKMTCCGELAESVRVVEGRHWQ